MVPASYNRPGHTVITPEYYSRAALTAATAAVLPLVAGAVGSTEPTYLLIRSHNNTGALPLHSKSPGITVWWKNPPRFVRCRYYNLGVSTTSAVWVRRSRTIAA